MAEHDADANDDDDDDDDEARLIEIRFVPIDKSVCKLFDILYRIYILFSGSTIRDTIRMSSIESG